MIYFSFKTNILNSIMWPFFSVKKELPYEMCWIAGIRTRDPCAGV